MVGTRSFKTGRTSNCFLIVQFKSGKWARRHPTRTGMFDRKASNGASVQANLLGN